MSVREALVLEVDGQEALLKVGTESGCGRCESAGGCRSGLLGELFGKRCSTYRVASVPGLAAGATVQVRLPEHGVLLAVACVYGLPLVGVLVAAVLAASLALSDGLAALMAFIGAVAGFAFGLAVSRQRGARRALAIRILDCPACGASE